MNGRRPSFFEIIARLPPRVWLQAALGLIGLAVLAVLGFAVIAGFVAVIGIYISSMIYMALFMWHFGKYPIWRGALIGFAVSAVFFLMFEIWFLVPLPKSPLDEALVPVVTAFMKSIGL